MRDHPRVAPAAIAAATGFETAPARALSVARATYLRLPPDVQLWQAGRQFVATDHAALTAALAGPGAGHAAVPRPVPRPAPP